MIRLPSDRILADLDPTNNRATSRGGRRACGGGRRQRAVGSESTHRFPNPAGANRAGFLVLAPCPEKQTGLEKG